MSAPALSLVTTNSRPDLFVLAADGTWCPAYQMRDRVIDGVYRTTFYVHHASGVAAVTPARLNELAEADRVLAPSALGTVPVIAVVDDDDETPASRPQSARLRDLDGETGATRWERLRRLLNARAGQYAKLTGADADDVRHRAAEAASGGATTSSMDLTESEMEDAVTIVEHILEDAGFNLAAADAEYAARRASRPALRRAA